MPGLVPGIHVLATLPAKKTWMAGTSPAMTERISMLIRREEARCLGLRGIQRALCGFAAGQDRLQRVVQRLGDALVVVGREFGHGLLELITGDRGGRKI